MEYELVNYIINDSKCEIALIDFLSSKTIEEWVYTHMELFNGISLRIDGLPSIASCNFQGRHFENVKEFHSFFRNAMEVMDDPFNN